MKQTIYFLMSLIVCPAVAFADGGTLRLSQRSGNYQVCVFTSPAAVRAGPIDVSVLVQDAATGQVCEDVSIVVQLHLAEQPALKLELPATRSVATNKLFRAAQFDLQLPGTWRANILVGENSTPSAAPLGFDFEVAPPSPPWLQLAPWVGWPLGLVALFLWHQHLAARREIKSARAFTRVAAKRSVPWAGTVRQDLAGGRQGSSAPAHWR